MGQSWSSLDIGKQLYEIDVLIKSIEKNSECKNYYGDDFFSVVAKMSPYYTNQTTFRIDMPFSVVYSTLLELKKYYEEKLIQIHNEDNPQYPMVDMVELYHLDKDELIKLQRVEKIKKII